MPHDPSNSTNIDSAAAARSTVDYFDREAPGWDKKYHRSRFFRQRYEELERLMRVRSLRPRRALDYGCGSGVLTEIVANHANETVASDASQEMLKLAARKFAGRPGVTVLPPADIRGRFDFIVCSSVIEYAADDATLLAGLSRLLADAGTLVMTFPNHHGPLQLLNRHVLARLRRSGYVTQQRHTYSFNSVTALLATSGLEIDSLYTEVGVPFIRRRRFGELIWAVARRSVHGGRGIVQRGGRLAVSHIS